MFSSKDAVMNFAYSIGAAIVIVGALFKLTHISFGFINGNLMLTIGLIAEAIIFVISAFDAPRTADHYAWENVYPELLDPNAQPKPRNITHQVTEVKQMEVSLSEKLDAMLREAKMDVEMFERLRTGIDNFSASVEQMNKTVDVSASTQKYSDQLALAASHLESMNALYALQLDHGRAQAEFSKKYVADMQASAMQSEQFNEELKGLTANVSNLNRVYGGMLNAMKA